MGKSSRGIRAVAIAGLTVLALAACGGGSGDDNSSNPKASGDKPQKGGTLTLLTSSEKLQHLDPQLMYTGEDAAMAQSYWQRQLVTYKASPDEKTSQELVPDLATDIGTPNDDATEWKFTIKDGVKWEDGNPLTCEDVKYGISRTFATDVISGGPVYAITMLDIPKAKDGSSVYKGPYTTKGNDTAAFDKALSCAGSTLTFKLNRPVPDFNFATTWGMGPVPKAADTKAKYDLKPMTSGPYKIQESTPNKQLVLVRNPNWDPATDDYRPAYPDKIVLKYLVSTQEIDQRMIADSGDDQQAISRDALDASVLPTVFNDPAMKARRTNVVDPYSQYIVVNVDKVPDQKQRQAIAVAMDRGQIRTNGGGEFAGDLADGVIKPNLPKDYAPSGMWTDMFGKKIPDSGDPAYAKQLIQESGKPMPDLTYQYTTGTPLAEKNAGAIKTSLEKAGMKVKLVPLPRGDFYTIIFDNDKAGSLMSNGWGPDWPNAVTVVPELFASDGGWNVSRSHDKNFDAMVAKAKVELDRDKQATMWKDLNKYAMDQVWAVPTIFGKDQRLAGSKVHSASAAEGTNVYIWPPAGSWPYVDLWVEH